MTLTQVIHTIEAVAGGQPTVRSIVRNDIFRLNSYPDAKYGVFGWTQGQHVSEIASSLITYRFTFIYIDRLTADQGNQVEIQSVGIQTLDNIIRLLEQNGVYSASEWTYTTFNQRFHDECAGVFASVAFQVPVQGLCGESFADFNLDFNEDFAISDVQIY